MNKFIISLLVIVVILVGIQLIIREPGISPAPSVTPTPFGGAPGGGLADNASSSQISLLNNADRNIFASSTCVARMVTSTATPIIVKIGDHAQWTLTNFVGHYLSASTTHIFDAATYGCGLWTARTYGNMPANSVNVTELRGFK